MNSRTASPAAGTAILEFLSESDIRLLGLMPHASNFTFLAELRAGPRTALGVYKPRDGETPLWDFREGTLCRREVAAYALAESLGWPSVPPTVLRDGPHGVGSVQLFVDASPTEHFFSMRPRRLEDFRAVAAFDAVANNADRKAGHCLLGLDETIWVVDHGVCFHAEPKLRTVIWDFAGQEVPSDLRRDVLTLVDDLRSGPLGEKLAGLLSQEEVEATTVRAESLAESGIFPHPGSSRPYPWPPV